MAQLSTRILSLGVNVDGLGPATDVNQPGTPKIVRGNKTLVDLFIKDEDTPFTDFSNLASITLQIKEQGAAGGAPAASANALLAKSTSTFDAGAVESSFKAGTAYHARLTLTSNDTSIAAGLHWLVIVAQTSDSEYITLAAGAIEVVEDGFDESGAAGAIAGGNQSGLEVITSSEDTVEVTFSPALGSTPTNILVSVYSPASGYNIFATVDHSTITTTGFTANLSAPVPNGNYRLSWLAIA